MGLRGGRREAKSSRVEIFGGLQKDLSLLLAREGSLPEGRARPFAASFIGDIHRNRAIGQDRHGRVSHRSIFHRDIHAARRRLLALLQGGFHGINSVGQHAFDALAVVSQRIARAFASLGM